MPDPAFFSKKKPTLQQQLSGTGLFDQAPEPARAPAPVRAPAQSVAAGSSEVGADQAKRLQEPQCVLILETLLRAGCLPGSERYLSRDAIQHAIGAERIRVTDLCARLAPSGPLLETAARAGVIRGKERTGISTVGNQVTGYQLTELGYDRVRRSA